MNRNSSLGAVGEIQLRKVSKSFITSNNSEFIAVQDLNLVVDSGRFIAIVGPSGCGKSTILNMVAGLYQPTEGEVLFRGAPVEGINPHVGYLTQQPNLLPWRRVEDNVRLALEISGVRRSEQAPRVARALELVGLGDFGSRFPSQLSGGMRQRVALARSLVYDPEALLMDEPFAALDAHLRLQMQDELLRIWQRDRKTVLFVTHDLDEAILLGDEIVIMGGRPGHVVRTESVPFDRPRDVMELRTSTQFSNMWKDLWKTMQLHGKER